MTNLENLKQDEVLKQILAESFGGVIYNITNKNKYNTKKLLKKWEKLTNCEKENVGGLITGAINFIK